MCAKKFMCAIGIYTLTSIFSPYICPLIRIEILLFWFSSANISQISRNNTGKKLYARVNARKLLLRCRFPKSFNWRAVVSQWDPFKAQPIPQPGSQPSLQAHSRAAQQPSVGGAQPRVEIWLLHNLCLDSLKALVRSQILEPDFD